MEISIYSATDHTIVLNKKMPKIMIRDLYMRAVIQRVNYARVIIDNRIISQIDKGLLVFVGIGKNDSEKDLNYMVNKIIGLRIFPDGEKESSLSVRNIDGKILLISQFTLYGDVRKGKRPSFSGAMESSKARELFERFIELLRQTEIPVECGVFQASMKVLLENDGPYTIILDSES